MAEKTQDTEEVHPAEEQGIEREKTEEETKEGMESGENDEDVYSEEGREKLENDSEIASWEEGFMEGAEKTGEQAMCAHCRKVLDQKKDKIFEQEINGRVVWFCSEECRKKGPRFKV